jgi:predicted LPLAT superfamily acyltransferase
LSNQAWQSQGERGTLFWLRVITWIALRIGRPVTWCLQYPITLYFFLTSRNTRQASYAFLERALGRPATWRDSFRQHRYFACTILDRVYLLSGRYQSLDIRIHGEEPILEQISNGSGCVILGSHLGSFEVLRSLGARRDEFSIRVLMRHEQNQVITEFLNELDPNIADVVIPLGHLDSMLRVQEEVDQGALIGLLGDRAVPGEDSHMCMFFDKPAPFPLAPMKLAMILKIPVYLFFGIYKGGNRYDIHFELLTDALDVGRGERHKMATQLTERFASQLEHYAATAPYNWFNFYDFWQSD